MVVVLIVLLFLLVVVAVLSPWRRGQPSAETQADERLQSFANEVLGLEAARDAKYREIRDAELDHETGHLTDDDFQAVDTALRTEAVEILKRLDRAQSRLAKLRAAEDEALAANGPQSMLEALDEEDGVRERRGHVPPSLPDESPARVDAE